MQGESKIYTDSTQTFINTDLFSPPIARRLKKQMASRMEALNGININGDEKSPKDTGF